MIIELKRLLSGGLRVFLALLLLSVPAFAQNLTALARIDPVASHISDGFLGQTDIELTLSQGVPYKVFTVADPPRLVLDFAEVDFSGLDAIDILPRPGRVFRLRFGAMSPGWSRMVFDLKEPMLPVTSEMSVSDQTGRAVLTVKLYGASEQAFAAYAQKSAPQSTGESQASALLRQDYVRRAGKFIVVLDPGHGGIDPGAERGGLVEKTLALDFARALRDSLRRSGVKVEMTRDTDRFVSLENRTALAHAYGASLFVSIHADALSAGGAEGATVYTLSDEASDEASAQLAARHNRSDILAGLDLSGADDQVTSVLLDLARRETEPRSEALARTIIEEMSVAGGPMNRKPWRRAGFSVLKSADIPSVLVEMGFISSARDRKNLADPVWRSVQAAAIADAIMRWRDEDAARAPLVHK